jgi:hypothetical protein
MLRLGGRRHSSKGYPLKMPMRTGTVATIDNRKEQ